MSITCDYCEKPAELVDGTVLYPHRRDLAALHFWRCVPCEAYVGCHRAGNGTSPLGRLAKLDLRLAKNAAHKAFDPMWQSGRLKRPEAYQWLADALGMHRSKCHIGMFDLDQCRAVVEACEREAA